MDLFKSATKVENRFETWVNYVKKMVNDELKKIQFKESDKVIFFLIFLVGLGLQGMFLFLDYYFEYSSKDFWLIPGALGIMGLGFYLFADKKGVGN